MLSYRIGFRSKNIANRLLHRSRRLFAEALKLRAEAREEAIAGFLARSHLSDLQAKNWFVAHQHAYQTACRYLGRARRQARRRMGGRAGKVA